LSDQANHGKPFNSQEADEGPKPRSDAERTFPKLVTMWALNGMNPGAMTNLGDYAKKKLEDNPYLRLGWEIALSVQADFPDQGFLSRIRRTARSVWQRWLRNWIVDKIGKRYEDTPVTSFCFVIVSVGGETEFRPETRQTIHHPLQDAFQVRILGLPPETVRQFAIELGKKFAQSKVQLRAFDQPKAEQVDIPA
jgi:hypothetical protein